jgi:hypothetical protein
MRAVTSFVLLSAVFAFALLARTQVPSDAAPVPHHIRISAKAAEKLLLGRVEVCYYPHAWAARVIGTVVVAIEIDKNGNVLHPTVVSGPALLRAPVLDAVENHYKYNPYLLNDRAVDVETTVSVFVGLQCNSATPYWIY